MKGKLICMFVVLLVIVFTLSEYVLVRDDHQIPLEPRVQVNRPKGQASLMPLSDGLAAKLAAWRNSDKSDTSPLPDPGYIPRRLFVTWKTQTLPLRAQQLWEQWGAAEPDLERIIIDDADCAALADRFPKLKPRYDALPMNVMRADICRVLAVYFFGGLYKDLDVGWVKPLKRWLDYSAHVVYGYEDEEHLCQWFFASRPGDPCIGSVLQHITNIIENVTAVDFNSHPEAVIDITGPGAFTDGMRGCPTPARFSIDEMKFNHMIHEYAAQRWAGPSYDSWLEDRRKMAGWKGIWPQDVRLTKYFLGSASSFIKSASPLPPLLVTEVRQSSTAFGTDILNGPLNAIDGSLDTSVETAGGPLEFWEVTFSHSLLVGTTATPTFDQLTCVRVFNHKRDRGSEHFNSGFYVDLLDSSGAILHRTTKKSGIVPQQTVYFAGNLIRIHRIRIFRQGGPISFSEIQFFSDRSCRQHRALHHKLKRNGEHSAPKALVLATKVTATCDAYSASVATRFQFTFCDRVPQDCLAVQIHNTSTLPLDLEFAGFLASMKCSALTIGPQTGGKWCVSDQNRMRCDTLDAVTRTLNSSRIDLAYLDLTADEWGTTTSLVQAAIQLRPRLLFSTLRFTLASVVDDSVSQELELLHRHYHLVSYHVNPEAGKLALPSVEIPRELQLSWIRQ